MSRLPLSHIRVLELGTAIASPYATSLLADAGAEVVKIETERRPDNLRHNFPMLDGVGGVNRSFYFNIINRNKLGLTIDLLHPEGRAHFLKLVGISDVVIENFAAGTMERMGVPYGELRKANPGIIHVSLSGFGATGPTRNYVAYGPLLESVAGFAMLGGYEGGPPSNSAFVYTDYVSALYGAMLALSGLARRQETGQGAYFDVSQAEVTFNAIPDAFLQYAVNGSIPKKKENRDEFIPVHGVYHCKGLEQWVTLGARTEEEWAALCKALGDPAWAQRPEFATPASRVAHQAELNKLIEAWTRRHTPQEATDILQQHGVASAPVYNIQQVYEDPHLRERGMWQDIVHPVIGRRPGYASPAFIHGASREIRKAAPLWAEDNTRIYAELLGMSPADITRLTEAKALV